MAEDEKKQRSTYSTAQFIKAYGVWISQIAANGGVNELHKEIAKGAKPTNEYYTRAKFNAIFMKVHNADMTKQYGSAGEDKFITKVDNTKVSQIYTYVKSSLTKQGYGPNQMLKLPPARTGATRRDWNDVAKLFLMGEPANSEIKD